MELYLITGFLGAGKTTFLKNFARQFAGRRLRLIINEFGRAGVDGTLLRELDAALDEISNGSIFCACRLDQFEAALEQAAAVGIELQPDAAQLARDNIRANGLSDRAQILCADLRAHRTLLPAGSFDLVVANPPYFAAGSGYTSPDPMRAHARDERTCTMQDICTAMAYLTRWGGSAALVHRPERLSELLCTLTAAGLEPKRLRTVAYKADTAPNLVLVEARRGGKPGLTVSPPLALCTPDGADSDEIRRIYHRRTQL